MESIQEKVRKLQGRFIVSYISEGIYLELKQKFERELRKWSKRVSYNLLVWKICYAKKIELRQPAVFEQQKAESKAEFCMWESFSRGRFLRHSGTKVIRDKKTNLEWLVGPNKDTTHYQAGNWVDSLGIPWRLPLRQELKNLYNSGITYKSWSPFKNTGWYVWSKEIRPDDFSSAWDFDFIEGSEYWVDRGCGNLNRSFAVRSRNDVFV